MPLQFANSASRSNTSVAVILVTFNSQKFLTSWIASINAQGRQPDRIIIVDSGSEDQAYLEELYRLSAEWTLIKEENVGFCVANNIAWRIAKDYRYVLYLNPDAFLTQNFLEKATSYMDDIRNCRVGMLTGSVLRYDIDTDRPTGLVDTTGVFQKWYGRFIERNQGEPNSVLDQHRSANEVPAICAAVVLCRTTALQEIAPDGNVFDPSYFMYKDDIDLSWRVGRAGWSLIHNPELIAYHCRGWKVRSEISKKMRIQSSRNEVMLFWKFRSPYILYSLAKYLMVRYLSI